MSQSLQVLAESGVGGIDIGAVEQGGFAVGIEPGHEESHGDAMVVVALQGGSVQGLAAGDGQSVVKLLHLRTHGAEVGDGGGYAVTLLHAEFCGVAYACCSFCKGGGYGQHGNFVDEIGDFVGIDLRGKEFAGAAHGDIAVGLAVSVFVGDGDIGSHAAQNGDDGVARGVKSDLSQGDVAVGDDACRYQPECSGRDIAGDGDVGSSDIDRPGHGDVQSVIRYSAGDMKMAEKALCVVAGDSRLMNGCSALAEHAGKQYGTLYLSACHGQFVVGGREPTAVDLQRGAARLCTAGSDAGSHPFQRVDDSLHRAAAQGGVAIHATAEGEGGKHACHQAHARAGIAAINIVCGSLRVHARAGKGEVLRAVARGDKGSQLLHGAQGIQAVLAAQVIAHIHAALRQRSEYGDAVGNALVARHGDGAVQAVGGAADGYGIT